MKKRHLSESDNATILRDWRKPVLYPGLYVWFVFVSAMDLMLTWIIIYLGGREVNPVADAVIWKGGLWGLVFFKFVLVTIVILICEMIGRRRMRVGRMIARFAVAITCVPVALALMQLARGVRSFA